ncbi:MAG: adenosylcobinamide-GDP ribazoletransferase, partial [Lachnospiraceae bacterium]|nr:adenosylcobinamide-GDP ribazoletransferase [Lachnospiraceae bacterium]
MHILKSVVIAFSIYSKIPVPQFEWKEEDMKYMLCFFPWIGAVVGGCLYLWHWLCVRFSVRELCYVVIGVVIPLTITGGFHVDGFMDTMDAFHSYQPKDRKLEILKDSHIGAFSVIMLAAYGLFYLGAFSEIADNRILKIV